jgi:hypothetical protein
MRSRAIYYKRDKEGINSKGRDKRIHNKGQDNRKDNKGEVQSFIHTSNALFINNFVNRRSSQGYIIKLFRGLIA